MPVDITPPVSATGNTSMDVLAAAIRDLIGEPIKSPATDGDKYTNAHLLRDFNRAVKIAAAIRKGVRDWFNVATTADTNACTLPTGVLQVYRANYKGTPLAPVNTWEKDLVIANSETLSGVYRYSIDGDPPSQITLLDAPTTTGTTDLKVYALYFPSDVDGVTSASYSPLPKYYDEYLIQKTAALLTQQDTDAAIYKSASREADIEEQVIQSLEEPRIKDPQGDVFHAISEYYPGEMD